MLVLLRHDASMTHAGCIQLAWRAYLLSPGRALRIQAVITVQAAVRAHAARRRVARLRQVSDANTAMQLALASGSRSKVEEAALQLRQAGDMSLCTSLPLTCHLAMDTPAAHYNHNNTSSMLY